MKDRIKKIKEWIIQNPEVAAASAFVGTCITVAITNNVYQKKRVNLMMESDEKFMNTLLDAREHGKYPIRDEFGFLWIAEPFKE